jgi:hypothetical protein
MELDTEIQETQEKKDLDTKWIEEFESLDENYKAFYAEDITYIKFHYIYVNKESDIDKMKEETILLRTPNYISREEIVGILKKHSKNAEKTYTVLSILKYNIDIEPYDINFFLKNTENNNENIFLKSVTNIDAIPLEKSITMFQDLNDIIIVFYEKGTNETILTTRRANQTKRIYLNHIRGHKRKTYRKMA